MRNTFFLLLFLISGACFSQDPFWDGIRTKLVQPDTLSTFDRDALTPKLGTILYHKDTGVSRWEQWDGTNWVEFGGDGEGLTIKKGIIDLADEDNQRNDQASIIRLDDGRLFVAYSHFFEGETDIDDAAIYGAYSSDNGVTWVDHFEFIPQIEEGTLLPNLYKKANGNVIVVYFVREAVAPTFDSTIRVREFSPDLSTIVTAESTILSSGYYPIGCDRLYYDETSSLLLMPYTSLVSGSGYSTSSVYEGGLLTSDDFGATWTDTGLTFGSTTLATNGFGGALEIGLFKNKDYVTLYYRTLIGNVYASDLTWTGTEYTKTDDYNIGLNAQNAMSTIKFIEDIESFVAVYTRVSENPVDGSQRKVIEISISRDASSWNNIIQVDNVDFGGYRVNEPTMYVDENTILIPYSFAAESNLYYDLIYAIYPKASLIGVQDKKFYTQTVNPKIANGNYNYIAESIFKIDSMPTSSYGNRIKTKATFSDSINNPLRSLYNQVLSMELIGEHVGGADPYIEINRMSNLSVQQLFDNIDIDIYSAVTTTPLTTSSFQNGTNITDFVSFHVPGVVNDTLPPPTGSITNRYAFRQDSPNDYNGFAGNSGFGTTTPTQKLHVSGGLMLMERGGDGGYFNAYGADSGGVRQSFAVFDATGSSSIFTYDQGAATYAITRIGHANNDNLSTTFDGTTGNVAAGGTVSGDDPVNDDDFVTKGYGDANYGVESGTFTPTLVDAGGGATYTVSTGSSFYSKIGNIVQVTMQLSTISTSGVPTGNLRISGLPYTATGSPSLSVSWFNNSNIAAANLDRLGFYMSNGQSYGTFTNLEASLSSITFSSPGAIILSGTYITSD